MKTLKGPAIFLAQFIRPDAPFNHLDTLAEWASSCGFKGIQVPTIDASIFPLDKAASDPTWCRELKEKLADKNIQITELSTHLQGQLMAVHPAYLPLYSQFAPEAYRKNAQSLHDWAHEQMLMTAEASANLGLKACASFSGSLAWPFIYPWPQRPKGLVEEAFAQLAERWKPILNAFDQADTDICFELHPGEDLHDGASFEYFLDLVDNHPRCHILYDPSHFVLQQLDYLGFIDRYHQRIKAFHVKDAELNCNERSGVYGGYQDWIDRPGRFRSLGDGQIDFNGIFSKLAQYDFDGWAVLEWECCLKDSIVGAKEGARFIQEHIIPVTERSFDDFADSGVSKQQLSLLLGSKNQERL
ncbi:sugar phosphate isomerase/epimerase [Sansalvadorimonas sp. 2012CJ34-2]|uniref:Sugar phosphate isomerase/epimerase n=1 Tax=Parendozoicomonas callyspongiae TaxID=2942213 RepID=A0ABT0PKL2_9GAMM|nr:sugar phosphate isomerase/epimerase family protein [Sansalvadorimonas sp. 2012CJ34-2]MCL6270988.1 sugar phosphate isomerase/epimerase [Sansalvadorimonas sp. 2012CJ34-2]